MSKQGKDGALSALQELLQRIAADHPNVKIVDMTCDGAGVGRCRGRGRLVPAACAAGILGQRGGRLRAGVGVSHGGDPSGA